MLGLLMGGAAPLVFVLAVNKIFSVPTRKGLVSAFAGGAATAFLALVAEDYAWVYLGPLLPVRFSLVIRVFIFVALTEEILKLSLLYVRANEYKGATFREYAIAAAAIGAGFAGTENFLYIIKFGESVILLRLLTATPFHIFNAIVSARLIKSAVERASPEYLALTLLLATFLHGLYDYLIFVDRVGNGKFLFALMLTSSLALGLLRRPQDNIRDAVKPTPGDRDL